MTGGMNRYRSQSKALRKQRIVRVAYSAYGGSYYDNLHQYSKNKIHCSCWLCSAKVSKYRGRGMRINYKASDQRKFDRLAYTE